MRIPLRLVRVILAAALALSPMPAEELAEARDWHSWIASGNTSVVMQDRIHEAITALDTRLAAVLAGCMSDLDPQGQALLAAEQATWLAWCRARVALIADEYRGGSLQGIHGDWEAVALRAARIRQLLADRKARAEP